MKARILCIAGETHDVEDFYFADLGNGRLKAAAGDWAHNLVGKIDGGYVGKTAARDAVAGSELTGPRLIEEINHAIAEQYVKLGIEGYRTDRAHAFTGYVSHVIVRPETAIVTAVGDVRVAFDGKIIAGKTKAVDIRNADIRKHYVERTGDAASGYNPIKDKILDQFKFQNVAGHRLSYPALDGTETLADGIEFMELPAPSRILLWTDGYLEPEEFTIEGLEDKLRRVYEVDPFRCGIFPAVGFLKDDRTAVEIEIDGDWNKLSVEFLNLQSP
jgi:hypothetical protein